MFDPDDYELHEAQKHACKMARERDEARVIADRLTAELDKCAAALPGVYYMDQPDGGDVSVSEQLRHMANDAERYRKLRRGQHWSVIDGIGDTLRAEALDAAVDAVPALPANGVFRRACTGAE